MTETRIADEQLEDLLELGRKATPTPWHVRDLRDNHATSLIAIAVTPDTGMRERFPSFDAKEIVAATLVQEPRYVNVADMKCRENAEYIAAAANALPAVIEELVELRMRFKKTPLKDL